MTETFKGSPGELENLIDKKKREVVRRDAAVLADAGIAGEGGAMERARRVWPECKSYPSRWGVFCHDDAVCDLHAAIAAALTEYRNEGIEEAAAYVLDGEENCNCGDDGPGAICSFHASDLPTQIRSLKRTP